MLVLSRKVKQQIQIGENIVITIVQVKGQTVRVGIEAPNSVRVVRAEIADLPAKSEQPAAGRASVVRHERVEAGRAETGGGFSSPVVSCTSLVGESSGLYPFVRRRLEATPATISSLAVVRG